MIFAGALYISGRTSLAPVIEKVRAGDPAEQAGLRQGDMILSINGRPIKTWNEMQRIVQASADQNLAFVVQRGSKDEKIEVTPRRRDLNTPFGVHRVGLIGVEPQVGPNAWVRETFSLPQSIGMGFSETGFIVERTVSYIVGIFSGRESADQISGPIRIAEISGEFAKVGFSSPDSPCRGFVGVDRAAQPAAGPDARRRAPAFLRHRGGEGAAAERTQSGAWL